MKITKSKLKQIIKEELSNILGEAAERTPTEEYKRWVGANYKRLGLVWKSAANLAKYILEKGIKAEVWTKIADEIDVARSDVAAAKKQKDESEDLA